MWTVNVEGLEFYAFHGVSDEEQRIGHRYRLDVSVHLSGIADPDLDDVANTVDYGALAEFLVGIGSATQFRTVEALAWTMAARLFQEFPVVEALDIALAKIAPPMPVIAEAAGVRLEVARDEWRALSGE